MWLPSVPRGTRWVLNDVDVDDGYSYIGERLIEGKTEDMGAQLDQLNYTSLLAKLVAS